MLVTCTECVTRITTWPWRGARTLALDSPNKEHTARVERQWQIVGTNAGMMLHGIAKSRATNTALFTSDCRPCLHCTNVLVERRDGTPQRSVHAARVDAPLRTCKGSCIACTLARPGLLCARMLFDTQHCGIYKDSSRQYT